MKILIVSEYGALNGGEFSFLAALPAIQKAGFDCVAVLPKDSGFADLLRRRNVDIIDYSFRDHEDVRKTQSTIRDELSSLIESVQPDIVHANSLAASRIVGPVTASMESTAGIGYLRDIIKLSRKAIDDIGMLDRIVAVSQATADFHAARGMPAEKISVIHNGVDLNRFRPSSEPSSSQTVLCIGQIGMRKGLDLSLSMLAKVFEQLPDARLQIVGERHSQKQEAIEYEQRLHEFVEENFASGSVQWLGRRDDIPDLMRRSRLLVHGAKQEPLGRVLLEAAASGLPIVTTNVGGTPEILEGVEELMFSPDRFDDAAVIARQILTDDTKYQSVSQQLRSIAEQKFAADRAGRELAETYLALLRK